MNGMFFRCLNAVGYSHISSIYSTLVDGIIPSFFCSSGIFKWESNASLLARNIGNHRRLY